LGPQNPTYVPEIITDFAELFVHDSPIRRTKL